MKNKIKWLGIIVLVVVIEFSFTACGGDDVSGGGDSGTSGGGGSGLVGKWYMTQEYADDAVAFACMYEFKSNGTFIVGNSDEYTYTATASTIVITVNGNKGQPANYTISGTELTITGSTATGFLQGTYYKPRR
jgi:hypothetical protein